MSDYDLSAWIRHVDELRGRGGHLAFGEWHGYLNDGAAPMRGRYVMVRWREPTVAVSHNDPENVVSLARAIERGLEAHIPPAVYRGMVPACGHTRASVQLVDGAAIVCEDCGKTVGQYDAWGEGK